MADIGMLSGYTQEVLVLNKQRYIIMAACLLVLAVVLFFMGRWLQQMVFGATQGLQQMGETPITDDVNPDDGEWVAPSLPISGYDDEGMNSVPPVADEPVKEELPYDDDDESVPVDVTAKDLANTDISDADVTDQTMDSEDES